MKNLTERANTQILSMRKSTSLRRNFATKRLEKKEKTAKQTINKNNVSRVGLKKNHNS